MKKESMLDIRKIFAIIQKNFIVMTRDKTRLFPLLLFPLFMILIFGYTTGNIPKHIPTAIVAYDHSPLSLEIQDAIGQNEVFNVRYVVSTEGEAKKLLDEGNVKVIILVPPDIQEDIEKGIQKSITIIIDESDASIASTTKSTFMSIISKISSRLSMKKLIYFQNSVFGSTQLIKSQTTQINTYDDIKEIATSSDNNLLEAQNLLENNAKQLIISAALTNIYVNRGENNIAYANNTYVLKPLGYDRNIAQISLLESTSNIVEGARANLNQIGHISGSSLETIRKSQEQYDIKSKIQKPYQRIDEFAEYNPTALLQPVVYGEKPAYGTGKRPIDFLIATIIALTIFQGAIMGMGRAVAGEKREGSLTRVFLTPTSDQTIIFGTLLFYILFEVFRSTYLVLVSMLFFDIKIQGSILAIGLVIVIYAGVSTAIGMILSSLVKTEQQYMGMSMLVSMPTIFLAGAFFPLQAMPKFLQTLAGLLPVTYAGEALQGVMIKGFNVTLIAYPLMILIVFFVVSLLILFSVFKRDIE